MRGRQEQGQHAPQQRVLILKDLAERPVAEDGPEAHRQRESGDLRRDGPFGVDAVRRRLGRLAVEDSRLLRYDLGSRGEACLRWERRASSRRPDEQGRHGQPAGRPKPI